MDTQLEYLRTQVNATLGWKLKHHHTEILKELFPVLTPMTDAVTHIQKEITYCKCSIQTLPAEIAAIVATITLGHASVQTQYEALPEKDPILFSNRPRLQSTVQHGMPEEHFGSRGGSTIHGESKS